jgi:NitT/TauT family transport system substrate-binding protein
VPGSTPGSLATIEPAELTFQTSRVERPGGCHESETTEGWSRRHFVRGLTLAGAAGLIGVRSGPSHADPPPETTKIRLFDCPIICVAPHYVAQELLHGEGFTDVQYVTWPSQTQNWPPEVLLSGEVDISLSFIPSDLIPIDASGPVVMLAGAHIGCVELFGSNEVSSTRELKGKTVAILQSQSDDQFFISMFVAYVGLDPHKDINWVVKNRRASMEGLAKGEIDAFMSGPPFSLEMREKKIGHVLVDTTTDKPWSQYFCCMYASTRDFVSKHPVATKRALRALLKAVDLCALEPERTAGLIVERGGTPRYDYALQMLKEIPFNSWRDYDPEDSVRFHALRMRELGMIKNSPQTIIAQGTDWRFLNELKGELKL